MKKILAVAALTIFSLEIHAQQNETFHDFTQLNITHDSVPLSDFAGKKVLVVNTASYCGYTYQLGELATLDSLYAGAGFALICFPCNDFGGQEPHDDSTIQNFYYSHYHGGFYLMSKISITAPDTAEVYKWLQLQNRNGVADVNVSWNFNKFCIDEAGHWVRHFSETVNPLDTAIVNWILSPNTTGITAKNNSADISLYGNPSYGKINLEINSPVAGNFSVELFDIQGSKAGHLFSGKIQDRKNISFTPENLKTGIYFLKVSGATTNKVMKVSYIN
jgi:glutathione peroxidase